MRITIARTAGFCWGVRRTVNKVLETTADAKAPVATLGPVIHNPQVIAKFESQGVKVYERVEDVPDDTTLIIRTHGAVVPQQALAKERKLDVIDGTCPYVKFPQVMAQRLSRDGYHLIIVGDANHAEIKGVASYAEGPYTILRTGAEIPALPGVKKVAVISQTTNDSTYFKKVVGEASLRFREVRALNTICYDTGERQTEVRELCEKVEVLIVVGGKMSANTRHLAEIGAEFLPHERVHHVERSDELDVSWFHGFREIGISAGASTPDDVIDDVARAIAAFAPDGAAERRFHSPSFEPTHANR
ncbi:4-hydroxy-3-methylbut-2-enyl diphosphate reductase [Vulgatibacter incomptus]|uniref:4-hydroxy-3-methylbut-2-enyl diphosphate reductase n=1 Tax=Vulgatibacter incomptus TaxID=1391653 RepID=A0A0K1PDD7_9BACT|nr:4-hydroxy-3-methylbut-2-enyl diphosphate reductase [Vulgatibacter incomptus]AKU91535.1 4-hydroxy-3-methylbut-2-enyl diphosphate reductase [Vulgatibacter incomptus]